MQCNRALCGLSASDVVKDVRVPGSISGELYMTEFPSIARGQLGYSCDQAVVTAGPQAVAGFAGKGNGAASAKQARKAAASAHRRHQDKVMVRLLSEPSRFPAAAACAAFAGVAAICRYGRQRRSCFANAETSRGVLACVLCMLPFIHLNAQPPLSRLTAVPKVQHVMQSAGNAGNKHAKWQQRPP